MNICMSGVDYVCADIARREKLSFVPSQTAAVLGRVRRAPGVIGAVLLSTCNRTELYLSLADGATADPAALLCDAADVPLPAMEDVLQTRTGDEAARHLAEVACGLRSQILGEDQIVTQVGRAAAIARETGAIDSTLETLFRGAVTAGKRVRTETTWAAVPRSAAARAVALAEQTLGPLNKTRCVVIGNGEMGRLASDLLVSRGADVTVTLRSYRHGETLVPRGCKTVPYDDRLSLLSGCGLVISATASPHYTLTRQQLAALAEAPQLVIDLALPRDVEPAASKVTDVRNMDDLGAFSDENEEARARAAQIVEEQLARFAQWAGYREALPLIEQLKEAVCARLPGNEEETRETVERTVDLVLGGLKGAVTPETLKACVDKIRERSRV
ncbi:glutamyl-tRNA reductase [Agathobaculum sp.]|uniref:glutamyl-tRNA reductase n=1 Tax=Agathobaculum sp. TaxID=2048138 RepID=UPI002A7F4C7E|nr:glutamyl-tRNA reductase [Agathobaculum sp.]MDY3619040.1 glutamyl-tRNA reductase [Agathobaculum sp.]